MKQHYVNEIHIKHTVYIAVKKVMKSLLIEFLYDYRCTLS